MRAVAGVQVRLATPVTSEVYVARELWRCATLSQCPWHPEGGCGFCRHGTYERVQPPGTLIRRWYCPRARRTVSALPDCLASHYGGTLAAAEAIVLAVEQAPSRMAAAEHLRTEIELPGALRYLNRVCRAVHAALTIIRGLEPLRFGAVSPTLQAFATVLPTSSVLMALRAALAKHLAWLPTPLGFNPPRTDVNSAVRRCQHRVGRDPPLALVASCPGTGRRPDNQE